MLSGVENLPKVTADVLKQNEEFLLEAVRGYRDTIVSSVSAWPLSAN